MGAGAAATPFPTYPYAPREARFLGVSLLAGWTVKRYAITVPGRAAVDEAALESVLRDMSASLPAPSALVDGISGNGLAFFVAHFDPDDVWYLLDRWVAGCILKQTLHRAAPAMPAAATDVTSEGYVACVWELAVIDHERRLWIETMMGGEPAPERYLASGLNGTV